MKEKETYTSPLCEALEMRIEGVIAASVDDVELGTTFNPPFGDEQEWLSL